MWDLDGEESWVLKNWCFWTVVLEKTLESPLDCKEIQPVHPKGDLSWVFIGGTDVEAETPILWPPHVKSWLIGKDPDAGKDWRQEEKGTMEYEMAGWHHRLDGHGFYWTPGVSDGQGGLECCDSWGRKESDTTERLNWTELAPKGRFSGWRLLVPTLQLSIFITGFTSLLSLVLRDPYYTVSEKHVWPLFVLKSFTWWGSEHLGLQMSGVLPWSFHSLGPVAGFCSSRMLKSLLLGGSRSPTFLMCVQPCDLSWPEQWRQTWSATARQGF